MAILKAQRPYECDLHIHTYVPYILLPLLGSVQQVLN